MRRQQQRSHRLTNNIRSAHNHRILTRQITGIRTQQHHTAQRCAGDQSRLTSGQPPNINQMKSINIFVWIDRINHGMGIDLSRQRQLDQNSMDRWITIKLINQHQEFTLGCLIRQPVFKRCHTDFHCLFALISDINFTGRIFTDQHHGEPRNQPMTGFKAAHGSRYTCSEFCSKRLTVNNFCHRDLVQFVAVRLTAQYFTSAIFPTGSRAALVSRLAAASW